MEFDIALRTVIPIFLLMGLGFLLRKIGILKAGDERILSAYVYHVPRFWLLAKLLVPFLVSNYPLSGLKPLKLGENESVKDERVTVQFFLNIPFWNTSSL
jgi:hypothetical protein